MLCILFEIFSCSVGVLEDLLLQCLHIFELPFGTDKVEKLHADIALIQIAAKVQNKGFNRHTVAAADCLVPGVGELVGGSQREERIDVLEARIKELGMNPEDYWWYLELRKYGTAKHAGFGMGFERMIMYLTGIANIRDVLPFPRTTGTAEF